MLHVVGPKNDVVPQDGVPTYVPVGFVDRMDYALAAADLMVYRGGRPASPRPPRSAADDLRAAPDRQRRAGAQRPGLVDAGERCWSSTATSRAWVTANVPPLVTDADRLAAIARLRRH